jgi:hypothetical protein
MCLNKAGSKAHTCNHLSHAFPIENYEMDTFLIQFFKFPSEHDIKKGLDNQKEVKLNGTHQLLVYVNGVNLLGKT